MCKQSKVEVLMVVMQTSIFTFVDSENIHNQLYDENKVSNQ